MMDFGECLLAVPEQQILCDVDASSEMLIRVFDLDHLSNLITNILPLLEGLFTNELKCSYVEESNADKAIKALAAALAPKAKVKRDGKVASIEATVRPL